MRAICAIEESNVSHADWSVDPNASHRALISSIGWGLHERAHLDSELVLIIRDVARHLVNHGHEPTVAGRCIAVVLG